MKEFGEIDDYQGISVMHFNSIVCVKNDYSHDKNSFGLRFERDASLKMIEEFVHILDPSFWKIVGKTENWGDFEIQHGSDIIFPRSFRCMLPKI